MYNEIVKLISNGGGRIHVLRNHTRRVGVKARILPVKRDFHSNPLVMGSRLSGTTGSPLQRGSTSNPTFPSNRLASVMSLSSIDEDEEESLIVAESLKQMLPQLELSSLDLELGEVTKWDDPENDDPLAEEIESAEVERHNNPSDPIQQSALEVLMNFDPQNPPNSSPRELQLWLECLAQQEAVERYQKVMDSARQRKDYASLSMVQKQILSWFPILCQEIQSKQDAYILNKKKNEDETSRVMKRYGPYLCTLSPEKLAVIAAHVGIMHALEKSGMDGSDGVTFISMARRIGEAVEEEVLIHRVLHKHFFDDSNENPATPYADDHLLGPTQQDEEIIAVDNGNDSPKDKALLWSYSSSHLKRYMDIISRYQASSKKYRAISHAVRRARQLLEEDAQWTDEDKIQLGAALFQILLDNATVSTRDRKEEMAFSYEKRWVRKDRVKSYIHLNDNLYKMIVSDKFQMLSASTTRYKPMIIPPKPWRALDDGGYLWLKADLLRYHGCRTQEEALQGADLSTVFNGLNALGSVGWRINKEILSVAQYCWTNNIPLGDIPSQTDYEVPAEPLKPVWAAVDLDKESPAYKEVMDQMKRYRDALAKYKRFRQKNMVCLM
jgi:DNA-directed RNA polymerase